MNCPDCNTPVETIVCHVPSELFDREYGVCPNCGYTVDVIKGSLGWFQWSSAVFATIVILALVWMLLS